jgi:secreted PhoX family phosphatase
VNKGHLWLPPEFNYQIISVQGTVMSDGQPTPGIFDGMAAYPGPNGNTILIRNHENREQSRAGSYGNPL